MPRLDPFLPPGLRAGSDATPRVVRRARVVVVEALMAAAALVTVALSLAVGGYPVMIVGQALAASLVPFAALALVRWGGRVHTAAALIAVALVTTPIAQAAMDYGVRDPALALIVIAPLAAAMASGLRLALATLALGVAGAGILLALHLGGHAFPYEATREAVMWWSFVVAASGATLSLMAGVLYVRHSEATLAVAEAEAARLLASLRATEARHQTLVERVPIGIYRTAPDGTFVLANPALATLIGAPSAEAAVGRSVTALYADPSRRVAFQAAIAQAGHVRGFEAEFRLPDGRRRIVRADAHSVFDTDGTLLYYEGTLEDVTDAIAAREAVARSEARFRALVQRSSDVTAVLDRDGRITYVSPAAERLLGTPPSALVGRRAFDWLHPDDRHAAETSFARTSQKPRVTQSSEIRLRHASGHYVYADGVSAALFDDPAVGGLVVNLRDATERKRAQAVLVQAKKQAEEVAHLKSTFLANMSHEIRTPLTAILGFSDVLADEITDPEQQEFVGLIAQGGRRLMDTLNSVLDLARLEAGRGELVLVPHVVADGVLEAVRLMQPQAAQRGLTLVAAVEAPDATAAIDDPAFGRVLHNLVGNALKFTPEGGRVALTVTADVRHVSVEVRDTGIGMDPEFLPRVFGEFEQASTGVERTHEGAGLGLSISRQLVERMGGTIRVASEKGVGTAFTVTLPRVAGAAAPEAPADARPLALVVDDNEQAQLVAARVLEGAYRVVCADSGEAALAAAHREPPDVAVLDIHLGRGADGTEVMKRLRELPALGSLPVVAVTAYGLTGDRARYLAMGFDDYVPKPYTRDVLTAAVARAFDASQSTVDG